jgi:hypothetical protein
MAVSNVDRMIASIRMTNHFLGLVDKYRTNNEIKLSEVLEEFATPYKPAGYRIAENSFLNQHQLISSLLVYIVLPKEKFFSDCPEIKIKDLNERWGLAHLNIDSNLKYFLRKMRNAIAHGNIEVTENLDFSFRDNDFDVTLNEQSIQNFCQALAYWALTKDANLTSLSK